MVTDFQDPEKGRLKLLSSPIRLSATPPEIRTAPAVFGEHTEEVLRELGYSVPQIKDLKKNGIV
jgi:crotonobetainyl-CoA:carnitine CoA-transferase CaiB-like acyl-CoA transferase